MGPASVAEESEHDGRVHDKLGKVGPPRAEMASIAARSTEA